MRLQAADRMSETAFEAAAVLLKLRISASAGPGAVVVKAVAAGRR